MTTIVSRVIVNQPSRATPQSNGHTPSSNGHTRYVMLRCKRCKAELGVILHAKPISALCSPCFATIGRQATDAAIARAMKESR